MDLDRLLRDPAYDLPVPPDALALVGRKAARIRRRRRMAVAGPVVALAVLAAPLLISGGGPQERAPDVAAGPTPSSGPQSEFGQDTVTPVPGPAPAGTRQRFVDLADRLVVIQQANNRLARDCMEAKGHRYAEPTRRPTEYDDLALPARYGLSVEQAERRGYGIGARTAGADADPDPNAAHLQLLTEAERREWNAAFGEGPAATATLDRPFMRGVAASLAGCFGQGSIELWGGPEQYGTSHFVLNAPSLVVQMARRDDDMAVLNSRWDRCMRLAGHPGLGSPDEAQKVIGEAYNAKDPLAAERETNVSRADAGCQAEIGYGPARTALEDRYLAGLAEQYADTLAHVESAVDRAHARAVMVLD